MRLKNLRKKRKMTQKDLADKLGVSISVISRYEAGIIFPSAERLKELAEALEVMPEEIELTPVLYEVEQKNEYNYINRILRYAILLRSKSHCELCGSEAPFIYHGEPYLKIYKLSEELSLVNSIDNYAALCPNCYEKVCLLNKPQDLTTIRDKIKSNMEED